MYLFFLLFPHTVMPLPCAEIPGLKFWFNNLLILFENNSSTIFSIVSLNSHLNFCKRQKLLRILNNNQLDLHIVLQRKELEVGPHLRILSEFANWGKTWDHLGRRWCSCFGTSDQIKSCYWYWGSHHSSDIFDMVESSKQVKENVCHRILVCYYDYLISLAINPFWLKIFLWESFFFGDENCFKWILKTAKKKKKIRDKHVIGKSLSEALLDIPPGCEKSAREWCTKLLSSKYKVHISTLYLLSHLI